MGVFALILLVAIVGGRLMAWLVKRRRPELADTIHSSVSSIMHGGLAVIFAWVAVGLAREGGVLLLGPVAASAVLAAWSIAMAGVFAWLTIRPPREDA